MENICEYTIRGEKKFFVRLSDKLTDNEAYLVGYLTCDGAYISSGKPGYPFISVSSTEQNIIEWIKNNFIPCATLMNTGQKSSEKVNAINDVYEIRFSPKASKQFAKFGLLNRKKDRRLISIPKQKMFPYIAGVIEADGFIGVTHRKDTRTPRLRLFVTHSSEKYLADLQDWLPLKTSIRQHGQNVWRLSSQNTSDNITFLKEVLPFMLNSKKIKILSDYLAKYTSTNSRVNCWKAEADQQPSHIDVEGSETTGERIHKPVIAPDAAFIAVKI